MGQEEETVWPQRAQDMKRNTVPGSTTAGPRKAVSGWKRLRSVFINLSVRTAWNYIILMMFIRAY
jgi:hypothetical protein